jgi:hypothetical protein
VGCTDSNAGCGCRYLDGNAYKHTNRHTDRDSKAYKHTNRDTDRDSDTYPYTESYKYASSH